MTKAVFATLVALSMMTLPIVAQEHGHQPADSHGHAGHAGGAEITQDGLSDLEAIRVMQKAMFDAPDNPLDMGPVVISGDYAISDWAQAGMGGRALLRKTDKGWGIHLCAGAGLRDAAELEKIGVPADIADDLAAQLTHAEAILPTDQISLYDSSDGVMVVDDSLI